MNCVKNSILVVTVLLLSFTAGCSSDSGPSGTSDISISGYRVGISAIFPGTSIAADGSSQAIIRVEVWNSFGQFVDGVNVTLVASLGSLGATDLTTVNGIAITTFTGSIAGNATVTVVLENIGATASIRVR